MCVVVTCSVSLSQSKERNTGGFILNVIGLEVRVRELVYGKPILDYPVFYGKITEISQGIFIR